MKNLVILFIIVSFVSSCSTGRIHKKAIEYNFKGMQMIKDGNYEMAEKSLEIAIEYNKDYPEPYNNLGIIYLRQNKIEKAEKYFSLAIEYNNDFAEAHNNLGYVYLLKGELKKAEQRFKNALNIDPSFTNARLNLARTYILLENLDKAEDELLKLRLISESEEVFSLLINTYIKKGRINKAFEVVELMSHNKNYQKKGIYLRGFLNLTLNRCNDAVQDFEKVQNDFLDNKEFLLNLSAAFLCNQEYEKAERILTGLLKMQADEPTVLFNLGKIEYEKKNYESAELYFKKSYELGFKSSCSYLVDTLFMNGKDEESLKVSKWCK
ncbi:MAG: tetratricopeptide repeat protein [Myxococcota bacterium]